MTSRKVLTEKQRQLLLLHINDSRRYVFLLPLPSFCSSPLIFFLFDIPKTRGYGRAFYCFFLAT